MRILIIGARDYSKIVAERLAESWNVIGLIGPTGASSHGGSPVPTVCTSELGSPAARQQVAALDPDVCVCVGWTEIIPPEILEIPSGVFLGAHAAELPKGRGGAPVNWQIIRGLDEIGVSVFEFVEEVDAGDVYAQSTVPVEPRDDVETVYDRVKMAILDLLDEALTAIQRGNASPEEQDHDRATYLPQRKPDDGLVEWDRPATEQLNWIRALTDPYPGAFTFLNGDRLFLWAATSREESAPAHATPGEVLSVVEGEGVDVCTGSGVIRLTRVGRDGGPRFWADEFASRFDIEQGDVLGTPSSFPDWLYTGIRDADGGLDYTTNVQVGESARLTAVACSHHSPRKVSLNVYLDGEREEHAELTVDGWSHHSVSLTPEAAGAHGVNIRFDAPDDYEDVRFIKIYAN
jgi:methionyl-tRNA formyltransferase